MPKITDSRIGKGKGNRNESIRNYFAKRFDGDKIQYDVVIEEIILKWGLSESTINQIIKGYGGYKN